MNLIESIFAKPHDPGGEDPYIRHSREIERDRVGKWRSWSPAEQAALWSVVGPLAARLGYAEP